jgi:hypothetical protein
MFKQNYWHWCCPALQRTNTQNSKQIFPEKLIVWPQSQFRHSCVCERFIYSQERSTYFLQQNRPDRLWEYINRSQAHECVNWDCGCAIPFLGIFVSNFRFWFFAALGSTSASSFVCLFCSKFWLKVWSKT